MADEAVGSVQSVAVESSPVSVESPTDAGLGATEAKAGPDKADAAYRKLQSQLDRERRRREQAEAEASNAYRLIGNARTKQSFEEAVRNAPDKYADPEGHARAIQAAAYRMVEQADEQRAEANARQERVAETNRQIDAHIASLNQKYGVELTRDDERIVIRGSGPEAARLFRATAESAAREAQLTKKLAELETRSNETLREAGIDRFDGGGTGGGALDGSMTFERWGQMSMKERNAWRRDKPEVVRAMEIRLERRAG